MTKIFLHFLYRRYFLQEAMGYSYWNLKNTSLVSSYTWWYTDKGNMCTTQWNGTLHLLKSEKFLRHFLNINSKKMYAYFHQFNASLVVFVCLVFFTDIHLNLISVAFMSWKFLRWCSFLFFFFLDCNNCNCVQKMYENFNEDVLHVQIYIHVRT